MNKRKFIQRLTENGLEKYYPKFECHFKHTIRLYFQTTNEENIGIGHSKIGGKPHLTNEDMWPKEKIINNNSEKNYLKNSTLPLAFLAQINLSETTSVDADHLLPKEGLVYFFYAANQDGYGLDYNDKEKFKVLYWNGDLNKLRRVDFPIDLPDYAYYNPYTVTMESGISLPSIGNEIYDNFSVEEESLFWNEVYNDHKANKMLGYANTIQGEMEIQCELVSNSIKCGNSLSFEDLRMEVLAQNKDEWILLLQLDHIEEDEKLFGDSGRLFFWIKKDDLINKKFDQVWTILQST